MADDDESNEQNILQQILESIRSNTARLDELSNRVSTVEIDRNMETFPSSRRSSMFAPSGQNLPTTPATSIRNNNRVSQQTEEPKAQVIVEAYKVDDKDKMQTLSVKAVLRLLLTYEEYKNKYSQR